MTRTYGKLVHGAPNGNPAWGIQATPPVMIKLRRLFPRTRTDTRGYAILRDTVEIARDLEWFLTRYPVDMDEPTAELLHARADEHRATEQAIDAILAGRQTTLDMPEPARSPRAYQRQAADIVLATGRLLLADDLGLGKSMSAALVLGAPKALPVLIVVPTHLPQQWVRELYATWPWLRSHIVTKTTPYDPATKRGSGGQQPDVLIMSYSKLSGWAHSLAGQVNTVIFDECQELRRGTLTDKGVGAAQVARDATYRMGLSATPVYNFGGEIHNIFEILAPDALGTREEFIREWGAREQGVSKHVAVADPAALGTYLREQGLMLRRTRADVHRELPEPIKITQPVDTDHATIDAVAGDVAALAERLLAEDSTPAERMTAAGEVDWRMRQATGIAKAPYVAEFVRLLLESEDKVVLFGWHRAVYEMWLDRLAEFQPVMYTGSESPKQKQASADAFIHGDSRVLLMSLRSGAGLDGLQKAASVAVFGELDWSPSMQDQCLGRLARDGQDSTVVAYYLVSDGGTDPLMAEVLGIKREQAEPIRDPQAALFEPQRGDPDHTKKLAASVLRRARRQTTGDAA